MRSQPSITVSPSKIANIQSSSSLSRYLDKDGESTLSSANQLPQRFNSHDMKKHVQVSGRDSMFTDRADVFVNSHAPIMCHQTRKNEAEEKVFGGSIASAAPGVPFGRGNGQRNTGSSVERGSSGVVSVAAAASTIGVTSAATSKESPVDVSAATNRSSTVEVGSKVNDAGGISLMSHARAKVASEREKQTNGNASSNHAGVNPRPITSAAAHLPSQSAMRPVQNDSGFAVSQPKPKSQSLWDKLKEESLTGKTAPAAAKTPSNPAPAHFNARSSNGWNSPSPNASGASLGNAPTQDTYSRPAYGLTGFVKKEIGAEGGAGGGRGVEAGMNGVSSSSRPAFKLTNFGKKPSEAKSVSSSSTFSYHTPKFVRDIQTSSKSSSTSFNYHVPKFATDVHSKPAAPQNVDAASDSAKPLDLWSKLKMESSGQVRD